MRPEARVGLEAEKNKTISADKGTPMRGSAMPELGHHAQSGDTPGRLSPPFADGTPDPRCVSLLRTGSYESGRYLELRAALEHKGPAEKGRIIAVTSPSAGDGKSLTASNLAGAFAQNTDFRVLLIDADLRRRSESLRRYLGVNANPRGGLTEMMREEGKNLNDSLLRLRQRPNLSVMLRGTRKVDAYETLASARFGNFLERIRLYYHYVILDIAPVLPVPDHSAIAEWVDGFVMVVTAQRTPRSVLAEAMRNIGPDKMMGIVLNQCEPLSERYYGYYGPYGDEATRSRGRKQIPG